MRASQPRLNAMLWITTLICLAALVCAAQQPVSAPRADGHFTPMLLYKAVGGTGPCAPLAIISHGAGGSERGYTYLAEAMSRNGFTTIVMGHRESGMDALRSDVRVDGFKKGITALVADPAAEQARLMDVGAALRWADLQCRAPFRVLLGHSMGSITVMLESGARNIIGGNGIGADRVTPLVTQTIASFLGGVRKSACTLPPATKGMALQAK